MSTKHTSECCQEEVEEKMFQASFRLSQKKQDKKIKLLEGKKLGRWEQEQKIKYYFFLASNQKLFDRKSLRKNDKVFKVMAKYIGSRTADQCRSHHQKIESKWDTKAVILQKLSIQCGRVDIHEIIQRYDGLLIEPPCIQVQNTRFQTAKNSNPYELLKFDSSTHLSNQSSIDLPIHEKNSPRMDLLEVESELSIGLLDLLDESYYSKFDDPFNFM